MLIRGAHGREGGSARFVPVRRGVARDSRFYPLAMAKKVPAVGIDLGTTYSCVGVWKNDAVEIIANDQGNRTTPSYVAFTDSERLIGDAAKNQVARNPENSVFDAKRLIGRKFDDPIVQADAKLWPFKLVKGANEKPMIQVHYQGEDKKARRAAGGAEAGHGGLFGGWGRRPRRAEGRLRPWSGASDS